MPSLPFVRIESDAVRLQRDAAHCLCHTADVEGEPDAIRRNGETGPVGQLERGGAEKHTFEYYANYGVRSQAQEISEQRMKSGAHDPLALALVRVRDYAPGMLASCYHAIVLPDRAERAPEDRLSEPKASPMSPLARSQAFTDLVFAAGVVCVSLPWASPSKSPFRYMSGLTAVLMLAAFQFAVEGLVPLLLIAVRRERLSAYGFTMRNAGKSVAFAVMFAAAYDLVLSFHAGAWLWVPLQRHTALRMALATGFPLSLVGLAVTIAAWGLLEGFFGVFVARRVNQMLGHSGSGWLAPGALGFALFNGSIHCAIGQGIEGFLTSFASGYAIGVIPAITDNAWGSAVFQTLTNSVGRR